MADAFSTQPPTIVEPAQPRRDRTHWLYILVIAGVILGILVGFMSPDFAKKCGILGTYFITLIKMMISPVIFCTIVLGIGSVAAASTVGKAGGIALGYFLTMSTFALGIGLVVGNFLHPGSGLTVVPHSADQYAKQAETASSNDFILSIIPTTLFSAVTTSSVLSTLFVALLVGFAVQRMGKQGEPILRGIAHLQKLVFRILLMVLWTAPIGAFGAIANVVGSTGVNALKQLGILMAGFYMTCIIFVLGVLGLLLYVVARVSILRLLAFLGREYLLIVSTSSSESALPNLLAKMEHAGVHKSTVGIVVPTGYSFNLDGTAIYLTMASIFVANAMGKPLDTGEQIALLLFMIVASKGAAGVSGAGLAVLAGGIQSHRPELLDGVGIVVGVDRFMSEARALTNFTGNAVATILVGCWTNTVDLDRVRYVLAGNDKFDYATLGDHGLDEPKDLHDLAHGIINPADELQPTPQPILPDEETRASAREFRRTHSHHHADERHGSDLTH